MVAALERRRRNRGRRRRRRMSHATHAQLVVSLQYGDEQTNCTRAPRSSIAHRTFVSSLSHESVRMTSVLLSFSFTFLSFSTSLCQNHPTVVLLAQRSLVLRSSASEITDRWQHNRVHNPAEERAAIEPMPPIPPLHSKRHHHHQHHRRLRHLRSFPV